MSHDVSPAAEWGIRPVLFEAGRWAVPAYPVFMLLAVAVGGAVYLVEARRNRTLGENTLVILLGALVGGALGSKLVMVILHFREIAAQFPDLRILLSGRSIVGALVGGALGVYLVKRGLHITERKGNLFAPAIAAGVAVGRIGCFLRGCCYGRPTPLPWGCDFGDGVPRHPTQLYESVFMVGLFAALVLLRKRVRHPAALFWMLMAVYFLFRFAAGFLRAEPPVFLGLTFFQCIAMAVGLVYVVRLARISKGWAAA